MGLIAIAGWIATIVLAYVLVGGYYGQVFEGVNRAYLSTLPFWITGAAAAVSLVCTALWVWRSRAADGSPFRTTRRRFILGTVGAAGGLATSVGAALGRNERWDSVTRRYIFRVKPEYKSEDYQTIWAGSRIAEYRRLGRTEALVSDISLGSGSSTGGRLTPEVAREAIERGMNYFDTAPDYSQTRSEQTIGKAMQGLRDKIFLATKFCTPRGHLPPGTPVKDYMEAVNASLGRLQTDYVDLVHIHSCDNVDRLLDENVHEAFDRLKEQGKVRFLGVSTHTPDLVTVANAAIDSGRFDVMMLAYHYAAWPTIGEVIDRAAQHDIGVVTMKTLRGALHRELPWSPKDADSFTQASFKWVLSNPSVSCLVISLWERAQIDEFFFASGKRPDAHDYAVLDRYDALTRETQCRPHCNLCLDKCSKGLAIPDVLRHRMYYENFDAKQEAKRLYAELEPQADVCLGCDAPCATACPFGIDIPERTRGAHDLLRIA